MHGLRRELLSQLCYVFGIQLRVSGWTLFERITGRSLFTCLRGLYLSYGFSLLCSLLLDYGLFSFEIKSTRK